MMNGRPTRSHDPSRGPFRALRRAITRLFGSRAFLLCLSLAVAMLFWSVLVASDGTLTRQKMFANVPVSVTGDAALQSRGYIVMDNVSELVPSVRMTVEVTQQNYDRATGTSYNPHFDLSQVTGEGENVLNIAYTSQLYGPVVACEPSSVTVNVERYMTRRVPVVVETVGETPRGVQLDATRTDPTMLSVSGPQSVVSAVTRAVVRLDASLLSAERMNDRTALAVELQDASGAAVVHEKLQITNQTIITDSVVVETDLIPTKDVPFDTDAFVAGEPAQGYELTGVTLAQNSVTVAGTQETLDAVTEITTDQPLDISGATGDVTGYVRLRRVSGVSGLPTEIAVTARVSEITRERTFSAVPVRIEGLDEEAYSASLSRKSVTAQITGGYFFVSGLKAEDILLYVEADGLEAGSHELPVQVHIDGAAGFSCALSSPQVTLTIREK